MDAFSILASILSGVTLLLVGAIARKTNSILHDFKEQQDARNEILKSTARRDIFEDYKRFVIKKEKMTIASYEDIEREYNAYKKLGGNGTAETYMSAIEELRPYIVTT